MPVDLNGASYSVPGPSNGAYYYDASALHRVFERGEIGILIGDKPVSGKTTALWSGESPAQMTS